MVRCYINMELTSIVALVAASTFGSLLAFAISFIFAMIFWRGFETSNSEKCKVDLVEVPWKGQKLQADKTQLSKVSIKRHTQDVSAKEQPKTDTETDSGTDTDTDTGTESETESSDSIEEPTKSVKVETVEETKYDSDIPKAYTIVTTDAKPENIPVTQPDVTTVGKVSPTTATVKTVGSPIKPDVETTVTEAVPSSNILPLQNHQVTVQAEQSSNVSETEHDVNVSDAIHERGDTNVKDDDFGIVANTEDVSLTSMTADVNKVDDSHEGAPMPVHVEDARLSTNEDVCQVPDSIPENSGEDDASKLNEVLDELVTNPSLDQSPASVIPKQPVSTPSYLERLEAKRSIKNNSKFVAKKLVKQRMVLKREEERQRELLARMELNKALNSEIGIFSEDVIDRTRKKIEFLQERLRLLDENVESVDSGDQSTA